jgi:hypothetical protein
MPSEVVPGKGGDTRWRKKIIGILVGLVVGWLVDEVATDALEAAGLPKHTAKVVGGVIGALA